MKKPGKLRYDVRIPECRYVVLGVLARNDADALAIAEEVIGFGGLRVTRFKVPRGWTDDRQHFYTKDSTYGVKYKCKVCDKEHLGYGRHNHWTFCPVQHERTL